MRIAILEPVFLRPDSEDLTDLSSLHELAEFSLLRQSVKTELESGKHHSKVKGSGKKVPYAYLRMIDAIVDSSTDEERLTHVLRDKVFVNNVPDVVAAANRFLARNMISFCIRCHPVNYSNSHVWRLERL
ncbi:hypothetical protein MSG34_19440 [Vibrio sp. 1CM2L]|uniref:hypothetical protein n=1 Tax=Vibrio sp. 1CM2L TaxID=2929166 RepID=UPI0020C14383|nr:hypothetical protein [Vibrio sp. 1CM2L]MCK8078337.1 hypothetical protein [Vibrio sp. 1CM2L]